jgi:hypothetical protein
MWRLAAGVCELSRISASMTIDAVRQDPGVICSVTRKSVAGTRCDELVQWMVQDASLDR